MKKIILMSLMAFGCVSADTTNCPRGNFEITGFFGAQNMATTQQKVEKTFGANVSAEIAKFSTRSILTDYINVNEGATPNDVSKIYAGVLNYADPSNFQSNYGLSGGMSFGYVSYFGCDQFLAGFELSAAYEGSFSKSKVPFYICQETLSNTQIEDSYSVKGIANIFDANNDARLSLRGGMTWGANLLLGKRLGNWGDARFIVGVKLKQFNLSYNVVNPNEAVSNADEFYTINPAENSLFTFNPDAILGTLSKKTKSKYAAGLSIGMKTNHYLNDNLSLGLTLTYDMYSPVSFQLNDIPVSAVVVDGGKQATDSGTFKFNNNCFTALISLTWSN